LAGWPANSSKSSPTVPPIQTCPLDAPPKDKKAKALFPFFKFFYFFEDFHFIKCKVRKIKYVVEMDKRKMMDNEVREKK
jgi:hypothetical protein